MPVETLPWSIQGQSHPATVARNHTAAMLGAAAQAETSAVGLTAGGSHGVVNAGDLAVTQNGTPNMSVNVAAGRAFIRGTQVAGSLNQGVYSFFNDGTVNLAIAAADPTNPRRDLVVAQIRDANYSGAANDARLFVVTGTPAASPADPTVPADCLVLARVAVAANATTITNGVITDVRTFARTPVRTAWGLVGRSAVTTTGSANPGTTALLGAPTFTALANRRYRITIGFYDAVIAGAGVTEVQIRRGATAIMAAYVGATAGTYPGRTLSITDVPGAGAVTYNFYTFTNATSIQIEASASAPFYIEVDDDGPV